MKVYLCLLAALLVTGCSPSAPEPSNPESVRAGDFNPLRNAYFGDTHIHTHYSFDAFIFNVRATPDDAYRYAKGEAIDHASGYKIQLQSGPLGFLAVCDHAEYLGVMRAMSDPESKLYPLQIAKEMRGETGLGIREKFRRVISVGTSGKLVPADDALEVSRSAWQEIIAAAERHYEPGKFTTFIGYEFTAGPDSQNLHRNVIFRSKAVPVLPFDSISTDNPEDLWAWLDERRAEGMEGMAIPHNSNGSNGQMFKPTKFAGEPLDVNYADLRMRNEPLVEVTQVKGTSETHPMNSPNDEWADFEIFPYRIATTIPSDVPGSYVREAYLNGLKLEDRVGFNPFRFGLIGSSDSHNAGGPVEESNFFSKIGLLDGKAEGRGSVPLSDPGPDGNEYSDSYYHWWGASGLAGVWAEENTRESIYDAMRRKETFATSGPRIRVRFFAGYDFPEDFADDTDVISKAYESGIPMGGDLVAQKDRTPRFLVWSLRDPESAPLQRLQVVKGWIEKGEANEQVFDVACSDGLDPDPSTHRCPDNGAAVDLADCSFGEELGSSELKTLWSDPAFNADQRAFYYLRVLENPTCRWSTWDALRAGVEPRADLPKTIQERAWSSPIWYVPPAR